MKEKNAPTETGSQPFKLLFGKKDSARILSVSIRTVENLIAFKKLSVKRIGRRVLIHRRDLEIFARQDHSFLGGE